MAIIFDVNSNILRRILIVNYYYYYCYSPLSTSCMIRNGAFVEECPNVASFDLLTFYQSVVLPNWVLSITKDNEKKKTC